MQLDSQLQTKLKTLQSSLQSMESVVVAYSGGVDSTLVARVAREVLGERAVAVTAVSASLSQEERGPAAALAQTIGIRHVTLTSHETDDPRYLANTPQRCYFCKSETYTLLAEFARQEGFHQIVDGTNLDDTGDHRPGRQAAREQGVRSPLQEASITKAEVRALARALGLPNWDKPAAACLSSRIPYGTLITLPALEQVAQAEAYLHSLGLRQLRVRHHGPVARLEVEPGDFPAVLAQREEIVSALKGFGYTYVTLDLAGFRSGSMNESLPGSRSKETIP